MGTHHQKQHILHPFRGSYANARRRAHHGPPCIRASKFPTHTPRKRAATVVPDDMAFDVNARRTQRIWFSRATEMRTWFGLDCLRARVRLRAWPPVRVSSSHSANGTKH